MNNPATFGISPSRLRQAHGHGWERSKPPATGSATDAEPRAHCLTPRLSFDIPNQGCQHALPLPKGCFVFFLGLCLFLWPETIVFSNFDVLH